MVSSCEVPRSMGGEVPRSMGGEVPRSMGGEVPRSMGGEVPSAPWSSAVTAAPAYNALFVRLAQNRVVYTPARREGCLH